MKPVAKWSRRNLMKLGVMSAGIPMASSALLPRAEAAPIPGDKGGPHGAMASLKSGLQMYYREDWLGAPWMDGEPAVFLHGALENGDIWWGWVPRMAQRYRVYRPDLPGYGRSNAPTNFEWTPTNYAKVISEFLDAIGVSSAHIIGAKTGGALAMQFAASYPQRVRSLVVASGPFGPVDSKMESAPMSLRLGTHASKEEMDYFEMLRQVTPAATKTGLRPMLTGLNLDNVLPQISARTLIITSDRSALQSVETVVKYQPKIPNSRLLVLTSDAYHVAVANADECVTNVLNFYDEAKRPA